MNPADLSNPILLRLQAQKKRAEALALNQEAYDLEEQAKQITYIHFNIPVLDMGAETECRA